MGLTIPLATLTIIASTAKETYNSAKWEKMHC